MKGDGYGNGYGRAMDIRMKLVFFMGPVIPEGACDHQRSSCSAPCRISDWTSRQRKEGYTTGSVGVGRRNITGNGNQKYNDGPLGIDWIWDGTWRKETKRKYPGSAGITGRTTHNSLQQ